MNAVHDVSAARYIELESAHAAHNYGPLDVVLTRGEGSRVWDVDGREYLDCLAAYGALNQGHGHPRIVEALIEQARTLALTSRAFRNDRLGPLCEQLSALSGYDKVLLMNSGAEAVETAIKAARRWGYRAKGIPEDEAEIVVFSGNFHGRTTTIVGFSSDPDTRADFGPFPAGFVAVPYGDLAATREAVGDATCAVLVEPIQGEAGVVLPPPEFIADLRRLCDERRALLICDEIQSGLGRTGHLFAHARDGIRADAVTIGKALSGGLYPVSAFLADDAVMGVFEPGSHGSTYGGNPLACAVASAALDVLVEEALIERAVVRGRWLEERLRAIRSDRIKEVRCAGLWAGIELHPDAGGAHDHVERLAQDGLLMKETHEHTLRVSPPLVIEPDQLEAACDKIERVLTS